MTLRAQVWVVDCADTRRLGDCKAEFEKLLLQERLAGSSLLVFANKQVRCAAARLPAALKKRVRRTCRAR